MLWTGIWLIVCVAAGALILAIRHAVKRRAASGGGGGQESPFWTWTERCGWLAGIVSMFAALWPLVASALATTASGTPAPSAAATQPAVVAASDGYVLRPCSWTMVCNDGDKVDLDTGKPGHGGSDILVGPAREGGPAEVILEDDHVHGSDSTARYVIAPATAASAADCANLLAHQKYRRPELGLEDLGQGAKVCAETTEKHVALVTVMRVSYEPVELEIAFTTWKP
ncbi:MULTISPECIES: hypothetical protein [Nonomuraea]|uniref:hypothetical protein n=1 Tax=Nonomuraea TaxID=83681 RepID=UPI001C5FD676|nr:hypothetical protein [Nonomuraea ceibae]